MTLGQRIQELRKNFGLSQEELGERMGVSRQAISKWEGDQTVPELDNLIALSKLFGLTVGQLLGVEQPVPALSAPKAPRWQKFLLAGMGAALAVLTVAVILLLAKLQGLSQQLSVEEEYVFNADRTVFETADYRFSGDGSALDLLLKPVKQLKGWELAGLTVDGIGSAEPLHELPLSFEQRAGSASLPLSELSSGRFVVRAVFRENKTSRTFTVTSFVIVISEGKREEGDVSSIEVTPIANAAGDLPRSVYLSLPDTRFD